MPHTPHAKYSLAGHPPMRQMLGPERVKALTLALALVRGKLVSAEPGPERDRLLKNQEQIESMLRGAEKVRC